jgi:hypothetical protein
MDFDMQVKRAIYQAIVETTRPPTVAEVAGRMGAPPAAVREAFGRLHAGHALVLEPDGKTIRMALPFSGVPTQHRVHVDGRGYFANCAWDALGIPTALHKRAIVESRCGWSHEPIRLEVDPDEPSPVDSVAPSCVVHFAVPAVHWWKDIVHT